MYRISRFLFISIIIFAACSGERKNEPAKSYPVIDDLGRKIEFHEPPQKVITLAPNLTEMIYELGVEGRLAGNTLYCNYPPAAENVTKVGDLLSFDYERILKIHPDLIFITVEGNTRAAFDKMQELGLKLFVSNPRDYDGIKKTYLDMGRIFKVEALADSAVNDWDSTIQRIRSQNVIFDKQSVLFLIDIKPVMAAGIYTFLDGYLMVCGLRNIAEDSPVNYPVFSREEVLKRSPDWIIYPTDGTVSINTLTSAYGEWNGLDAIKSKRVIFAERDLFFRPGPRFAEAADTLFTRLLRKENLPRQN